MQERLIGKHDKQSSEGRALRSLREIRVAAAPDWDAPEVTLTLYFIRDSGVLAFDGKPWHEWLHGWLGCLASGSRFVFDGLVVTLDDLTGRDYVESDALDLDHLSTRAP